MPPTLKQRAAELEALVKERAELVKKVLKDYRETVRATSRISKGTAIKPRDRARLAQKQVALERANAEYMKLQKELDSLVSRMQTRIQPKMQTKMQAKMQTRKRAAKSATH